MSAIPETNPIKLCIRTVESKWEEDGTITDLPEKARLELADLEADRERLEWCKKWLGEYSFDEDVRDGITFYRLRSTYSGFTDGDWRQTENEVIDDAMARDGEGA